MEVSSADCDCRDCREESSNILPQRERVGGELYGGEWCEVSLCRRVVRSEIVGSVGRRVVIRYVKRDT